MIRFFLSLLLLSAIAFGAEAQTLSNERFLAYEVYLKSQNLQMIWKDSDGKTVSNFKTLKQQLAEDGKTLVFAMNGGMFRVDQSPQGLYIENGKELHQINKVQEAYGNFYMQPNGIFYITNQQEAVVVATKDFEPNKDIKFATQSGPMLLIDGDFHPAFNKGSSNLNIRNGVGVLPNGNLLFVMSKVEVNFYDFAQFFKELGCQNALYLDGAVSRTYLPSQQWQQLEGGFGVIIFEVE
ncbi:MAG: phosphodiester glycosidase family protein [Salibacteraceae bacterium]|nr:phosphodiester glycosidase family protein [Salibacteraceae bacterium]